MSRSSLDLWVENVSTGAGVADDDWEGQQQQQQQQQQNLPEQYQHRGDAASQEHSSLHYDINVLGQAADTSALESIPDILLLAHFCSEALPPNGNSEQALLESDRSWDPVRDWMRTHSAEEVHAAALQVDEAGKTALHLACQNNPPNDVIDVFMSIVAETTQWSDGFGWLPIHYACAYAASTYAIKSLMEAYPESKTTVDRKGRTPLHFALGTTNANSAAIVLILSSTGAASFADDNGMLPLHYACAYGASEDCLLVLTDAYLNAISHRDRKGRTPLHFSLSNAGRPAASSAVRLLLGLKKDLVNAKGGSPLPLKVLAEYASIVHEDHKLERESCRACLRHLLSAEPNPSADFFTALQALPEFLQEHAVVMKVVQELLNFKISQRFCSLILITDFYVQMLVVTYYSITVQESVNLRFNDIPEDASIEMKLLYPLYIGVSYFLLREIINFLSLLSLGAVRSWAIEPGTWLNILYIVLVYFWTFQMQMGTLDNTLFRYGAAISIVVLWIKFLGYLRNMMIEFAVFTGGVFHVMRRLAAFFVCLVFILVAFSRMWYTLFLESDYCLYQPIDSMTPEEIVTDLQCNVLVVHPWCDSWDSFLAAYNMLLGNVDENLFKSSRAAMVLFVLFMFLVVILLANVLIAIVTDSYKVIQDQRAAIVFWTNRLNFISQMDAIANGPWKKLFREFFDMEDPGKTTSLTNVFGRDYWNRLMGMFEEEIEGSTLSLEYLMATLVRLWAIFVIIPAWIVLGICTFGWLWPPQLREYIFTSAVSKHNNEAAKEEELRRDQLVKVKAEIVSMGEDLRQELALDRTQIIQTKSLVEERKQAIQTEMKHIKRVMAMLFEQQSGV